MDKNRVLALKNSFDEVLHSVKDAQVEYWLARDLMARLGYIRWENFETAIKRAMTACEGVGLSVPDHFLDVTNMVPLGSGAERPINDYMLTRYACYLIAMNGDPRKEEIAFAQSYFAVEKKLAAHSGRLPETDFGNDSNPEGDVQ